MTETYDGIVGLWLLIMSIVYVISGVVMSLLITDKQEDT